MASRYPRPNLTLADGTVLKGQDACDAMDSESTDFGAQHNGATRLPDPGALTLGEQNYRDLRYPNLIEDSRDMLPTTPGVQVQVYPPPNAKTPATYPAPPPGVLFQTKREVDDAFPAKYDPTSDGVTTRSTPWRAQYSRPYLLQTWTGDDAVGATSNPARTGGGFFPNIHNNYIRAELNRKFGEVAVVQGKLASHPETSRHNRRMGTGQVRYSSFCVNESVYTTKVMDCVYDEEVPTDKDSNYTIVTSLAGDRPSNALAACGNAWIEWSPSGDGYRDSDFGWFQIRNMIPDTGFDQAVQNTQRPGDEIDAMGDYLPDVTYMSTEQFEKRFGCAGR